MLMIVCPISLVGLNHYSVRHLAILDNANKSDEIRGFVVVASIIVFCTSSIAALITMKIIANNSLASLSNGIGNLTYLIVALAILTALSLLFSFILQGLSKPAKALLCQSILPPLICSICAIYFFKINILNLYHTFYLFGLGVLIATALSMVFTIKAVKFGAMSFPEINFFKRSTLYFWVVSIGTSIINWAPLLLLGIMYSSTDVATYNAALRISSGLLLLQITFALVLSPRIAVLYETKEFRQLESLLRKTTLTLLALYLPLAAVIYFNSESILQLFGNDFRAGAKFLSILLVGQLVITTAGLANQLLLMSHNENQMGKISLFSAIICVVVTVVSLRLFGPIGAALGTAIGVSLQNALAAYYSHFHMGIKPFSLRR